MKVHFSFTLLCSVGFIYIQKAVPRTDNNQVSRSHLMTSTIVVPITCSIYVAIAHEYFLYHLNGESFMKFDAKRINKERKRRITNLNNYKL